MGNEKDVELQEFLGKIGGVVETAVKPLQETQAKVAGEMTTIKSALEAALARIEVIEKRPLAATVVRRVDAFGREVDLGAEVPGAGPAFLRTGVNRTSQPFQVTNILRGVLARDVDKYASEEKAFSDRLKDAGYHMDFLGSIFFPMGESLIPAKMQDSKTDFAALRKELSERLPVSFDPGEIGWLTKRYPDFVTRTVGKAAGDMMVGDDTLGGYLIPPAQSDRIIDLLRNRLSVMKAGATEIPLPPSGNITWVRLTEDPAPTYGDPDTTTDETATAPKLAPVRLIAKSLRAWVTIPNDLLRYSSPSVELLVRMALAGKFAVKEDNQFLEGIGSTLAPKGIINYGLSTAETPTPGKVTLHIASTTGGSGDTFEPEDVLKMMALYYTGNDPDPLTGWIMRPMRWADIFNKRADAVSANDKKGPFMFWTSRGAGEASVAERLGGVPVYPTAQATNNRVKSATNLDYILLGNFRRAVIGRVGTLELAVSEHVRFMQDKIVIRGVERHDMGLEHEESFVFVDTLA